MRYTLWILLLALASPVPMEAQQPETVLPDSATTSGFGGPFVRFTTLRGTFGAVVGGHGGLLIDHRFVIGGAAGAVVGTGIDAPFAGPSGEPLHLNVEYGGVELQFITQPMRVVHFTIVILVGGGAARYQDGVTISSDGFFVFEPGATIAINVTRRVRLNIGATYRDVTGITMPGLTNSEVSGLTGLWSIEFGRF